MKNIISFFAFLLICTNSLLAQWSQITNIPVASVPLQIYGGNADVDGSNIYLGTGDGIYKSTNNGATFQLINTDLLFPTIQASGNTVCAFSSWTYEFYYSTDGGVTFQSSGYYGYISSMLVQGSKVFIVAEAGLLVSDDHGATFTNTDITPPGWYGGGGSIVQTPIGKIFVYSAYDPNTFEFLGSVIHRSTDGVNWTEISGSAGSNPLPTMQSSGRQIYHYSLGYVNGTILVGSYSFDGLGSLYKSTDQGANWYPVNTSQFAYFSTVMAFGSSRAFVYDDYFTIQTSTDGSNWSLSNAPADIYSGEGNKFYAHDYINYFMYLSTDNGATWPKIGLQQNRDQARDYLAIRANTRFVVTNHNGIYKGTGNNPASMTWTKVLGAGVNGGGNYGWDILRKGTVLLAGVDDVAGGQKGVFRSTNEGSTWTKTHSGTGLCFFDDGSAIYAGIDQQGIFKSNNSGQTWTAANGGIPSDPGLRRPSAFTRAGNHVIASFYSGGIYLSSNQGASWSQVSTEELVYCLAKAGSDLFAGTQNGLMKSTDNGLTWNYVQNDLYYATAVTALYVKSADEMYIGTGSMGMFVTNDGGETLEDMNDGVGNNLFVSCITREGGKLFAGLNQDAQSYYYYYQDTYFGRMLWQYNSPSNNPDNEPAAATDRTEAGTSEPRLVVFPNPVQDVLQFSLNIEPGNVVNLQIINSKGELVREEQGPLIRPALEVQNLVNGAYFLKINLQDGTSMTQRFMVIRAR